MLVSPRRAPRRGGVAAWFVLCLAVLVGVMALAMDGGRMMDERRHAQSAADAAALAAAADLYENYRLNRGTDPAGTARSAALRSAADNGYANDEAASVVTVNIPPLAGPFAGKAEYVEVVIESRLDAGFGRVFGGDKLPVRARAVARGRPKPVGVVTLDPNDFVGLLQVGGGRTEVAGPVAVNSASTTALYQLGGGVLKADAVDVVGGVHQGGTILGRLRTGVAPTPDPLRRLPAPDPVEYTVRGGSKTKVNSDATLQPGVYREGIQVGGGAVLTLAPGVYILDGGGLKVGGGATVIGDGVMLYNTGAQAKRLKVAGNASLRLTPPTGGTYQGISLFQDRGLGQLITIGTGGNTRIEGVIYAPSAVVAIYGSGDGGPVAGGVVSKTLILAPIEENQDDDDDDDRPKVTGTGTFLIDGGSNRPKLPEVRLVD